MFSDSDRESTRPSSGVRGQWVRPGSIGVEPDDVINTSYIHIYIYIYIYLYINKF